MKGIFKLITNYLLNEYFIAILLLKLKLPWLAIVLLILGPVLLVVLIGQRPTQQPIADFRASSFDCIRFFDSDVSQQQPD